MHVQGQPTIFLHQPAAGTANMPVPVVLPAVPPPRAVPRRMPEIVDEGVRAVRRDIGLYTAVAAFTVIPARLLAAGVSTLFTPFNPLDPFTYYRVGAHAAITTSVSATFVITALASFVSLAITTLGTGALVTVAGLRTLGQPCTVGAAYAQARRRYWSLLGASVLSRLALVGITVFSFFVASPVALWLFVGWQLAPQVIVLEGRRALPGLGRSLHLVRGSWWRFAMLLVLVGVLQLYATAIPGAIGFLIGSFTESKDLLGGSVGIFVLATVSALIDLLMLPIAVTITTLYFTDLRIRKEGFDVDILLQRGAAARLAVGR
jgi:hypothetical protein